ncbi:hypothetical protein EZV62_014665 [Acer yangbiense]|uniref:Adenylate kinase n=1 Tax=Acer yangbiense TaxID=1000413 RepID=A0A5C7HV85_9ROSI|nr:hypothetical protein EZV62_014665 [Acer yangbiense]
MSTISHGPNSNFQGPSMQYRATGRLVPEEVIFALLSKRLEEGYCRGESGFILDGIPRTRIQADPLEVGEESVTNVPCIAAPPLYTPPSAAAVSGTIGEIGNQSQLRRSGSSVVRKSYTSDDELDELNSPLSSIFIDGSRTSPVSRRSNWISKENNN